MAQSATKPEVLATDVLRGVGGQENVASVTHCATRLRFQLKDRSKADRPALESIPGVMAVMEAGGQFQVVVGSQANSVYEALNTTASGTAETSTSRNLASRAIDLVTSIVTPVIWVLAASGLIKAALGLAAVIWPSFASTTTYAVLFLAGDAIFQFLPVVLAITAARRFAANLYVSVTIAAALVYSATIGVVAGADGASVPLSTFASTGGDLNFLGIPVVMTNYLSSVIPIVIAVYVQSQFEKWLNRVIPAAVRNFVVPMIVLLFIIPATFLAIGPVANLVGVGLAAAVNWLFALSPMVAGLVMGGLWQVFVIFGVHWGFVPVIFQDLQSPGYSLLVGPLFAAVLAQAGAAAGVAVRTKNRDLKLVAWPASVSALVAGISEPAIYGVTLRLKQPFIFGAVAAAVGGAIAAAGGSGIATFVLPSGLGLAATVGVGNFAFQAIGSAVALVLAFLLTLIFGFRDVPVNQSSGTTDTADISAEVAAAPVVPVGSMLTVTGTLEVGAPVAGTLIPLSEVPDKAFASGVLGEGVGIIPAHGRASSPIDGVVKAAMPHAFGISNGDVEVLVHIGLDTVQLKGRHFTPLVSVGDTVRRGIPLADFDITEIEREGFNPVTVMVVTRTAESANVSTVAAGNVPANATVLAVTRK